MVTSVTGEVASLKFAVMHPPRTVQSYVKPELLELVVAFAISSAGLPTGTVKGAAGVDGLEVWLL